MILLTIVLDNDKSKIIIPDGKDAASVVYKLNEREENDLHNDKNKKQVLSEYRDKLIGDSSVYCELNLDDYSDLNICKLFLDMFLSLDNVMIKFGDKFKNQLNDGEDGSQSERVKLIAIALKKGLLNEFKNKRFLLKWNLFKST